MSLLVYLGAGALVGALVRWWRPGMGWAWIAGYWLAAGAWFAAPLVTSAVEGPFDLAYSFRPWREVVEAPVVPANGLLSDVPLQMLPFRALVRDRLLHGEAPLWAHEMGTGQPLLGNAQSAPFSPFGLLTLPLAPVDGLPVAAALKLFVSLLLTDALLTALGAGRAGACLAAVAYAFSVFSICWAFYPLGAAAAWLPGILLGLVLLRRGERGGLAGLTACATGMALAGHPETLAHTALAAGAVAAALLLGSAGGRPRWRFLGGMAAAAAMTAGLAAPVLLPFVETIPDTVRGQLLTLGGKGVQPPPFAAATLNLALDPLAMGSPRDGNWSGISNFNEVASGYAGLLALALAAAAGLVLGGRALAVLGGGGAALAAALAVPPFLGAVRALPLLDHAANGRLRLVWVLAVAVAAGLGIEALAARRAGRWGAAACCAAAACGLALEPGPAPPWQRAWWLAAIAGAACCAVAFLAAAVRPRADGAAAMRSPTDGADGAPRKSRWAAALPWLAVACLAVDLGLLNGRYLPVLPGRFGLAPPPAIQVMAAAMQSGGGADGGGPFRVIGQGEALLPNLAALYGLWDPRSNDPMQPARATLVVGRALHGRYRLGDPALLERRPYPVPFLSYLGVRYILTRHREELFPPWEEAWDGTGGKLWRNPEALPLFFMPAAWRAAAAPGDALRATLANQDFAASAVAEEAGAGAGPHRQAGQVRLLAVRANAFDLAIDSPTGGLVASSVTGAAGWRLAVDGRAEPLLRVNAAFLGFLAPAGRHRAVLAYQPAGWTWGLRLCGLTVLAILVAVAAAGVARAARDRDRAAG